MTPTVSVVIPVFDEEHVLPELRSRGLFREEYDADTLRGNYGLPRPENQFDLLDAAAGRSA